MNGFAEDGPSDSDRLNLLAALSPIDYDRQREEAATTLKIRVSTLDDIIRRMRGDPNPRYDNDPRPPEFSDEALALRFTAKHPTTLRYVAAWGKWYVWSGKVWTPDETMIVFNLSRELCRAVSATVNDPSVAVAVASARTIAAVERLARADPAHAATVNEWDADPWLLNTPEATINLRTGQTLPHTPSHRITRMTAVSPAGDCPLWRQFLATITADDKDLQLYLQRVAGYALTGTTHEHAMFFGHGSGRNGKGVFLNTLTGIWASYGATAVVETFIASSHDRHPTELAKLRGARLVTAQETEQGRQWAEARIKALTGGDPISARFMRQDFFEFFPQFKLFIAGNNKPGLRSVDEAIRSRMNLIPFLVTIPPDQRDTQLTEKLRAEWPGILLWALDGCALWREGGLNPPASVRDATADYLADEDSLQLWIQDCCDLKSSFEGGSTALFRSWKEWAERANEPPGSQKRFVQTMNARGFETIEIGKAQTRGLKGISLKPYDIDSGTRYE